MNIKYLALGTLLGLANLANANSYHGQTPIDFNTPLPALESLEKVEKIDFHLPNFERFFAVGGVPVIFTKLDGLPMVDIDVSFRAGSAHDDQIRPNAQGIANMTADLLNKGTKTLNEEGFLLMRDNLGIKLGAGASKDSFSVSLRSLSDDKILNDALDLMKQMLTEPIFDDAVLARNKENLKNSIKQSEQDPSYVASRTYSQALFGNHPYAALTTGDLAAVDKLSRNDLMAFKDKFLVRQNAIITITGNLEKSQAKKIADNIASALPNGKKSDVIPTPKKPIHKHIHVPHDSTQTSIIIGHLAPKFATDDKSFVQGTRFNLANSVMAGGSFNARLMDEIREKRGYTYGIHGNGLAMASAGSYQVSFSTAAHQAKNAIEQTLKVINETVTKGIRQDELDLVASQQKHQYPMNFASNADIHSIATIMNFYGLPDSYAVDEIKRIQNTTLDDANQALKDIVHPDEFIIITVGQEKPDLSNIITP